MIQKQTVYLPVKLDDEFWTKWDNGEKPDYDLSDVDTGENIESWVNEKEGYFFTPEQLNEYTANVIKRALETAADKAEIEDIGGVGKDGEYFKQFGMNKEFIPYEQALELKELGFDEPCFGYYNTMGFNRYFDNIKNSDNLIESENIKGNWCTAPTFSQAFRWFRENHQLPCWVYTSNNKEYWYSVIKNGRMIVRNYKPFQSYEEAELACLRKLIELVKNK